MSPQARRDELAQMHRLLEEMSDEELMGEMWADYMHLRELRGLRLGDRISQEALSTWLLDYLRRRMAHDTN